MREALSNLVTNAITYTPAEGTITLFAAGDTRAGASTSRTTAPA
jgi:two-component system sensor histidine kinase TctE